jgi:hypothetical protein
MDGTAETTRPSAYQLGLLRDAGIRIRPHSYESAKRRLDRLAPSSNQAALLTELGLAVPASREEASAALTAYEQAHPEWARERRAARSAKGQATRAAQEQAGQQPRYNETLLRYHAAATERHGKAAASLDALAYLRALALQLPKDSASRVEVFTAMGAGLSADDARTRIDGLKSPGTA